MQTHMYVFRMLTAKACMGRSIRIFIRLVGTSITGIWNILKNSFSCKKLKKHVSQTALRSQECDSFETD